ncbi:MAG TPA: 1-deoxy-D-xylulose-5-phosphate synthase N-terminal domain-containing protein [Candidatus Binatia bacterium]|nr:1-deoxy-D-xylulose-5-phosphate synthase N-terminal domain-containing protein [Candidatus Binatia bacterium]
MPRRPSPDADLAVLERIQRRVLWLAAWMVHHANTLRPNSDGTKIGGHQASSASVVTLMTALYFRWLRPGDVVATKAHASPVFYAIQYLRGRLSADDLRALRVFGGLQAYPSRRKNPGVVDLSTGSMGLGAVSALFSAMAGQYLADHVGPRPPERFVAIVGDAELDEGNVWEALLEDALRALSNVIWIVDLNRQSLDRIAPDVRRHQLRALFEAGGWRVIELRWGSRLAALFRRPGGRRLRARLESMPNEEYQALLRSPAGAVRKALSAARGGEPDAAVDTLLAPIADEAVGGLVADVGGHDLRAILGALAAAEADPARPAVIIADTIKGWGLPMAGDPMNHGALLTAAQMDDLRRVVGVAPGEEWAPWPPGSEEDRLVRSLPPLFAAPAAAPVEADVPADLAETYPPETSTQEAFGRVLGRLGRLPLGDRIVTMSADVAVTTHLAGWINRKGIYAARPRPSFFEDVAQAMAWRESRRGQHVELGIAEHNLFLALGAFGLTRELSGELLLPIGTLYDPFVIRGLDALYHALYAGGRFIVAATPSGVSLSPEGGAHQSVVTPAIGIGLPEIVYYDPAFGHEVEWILLDGLRRLAERGESLYLRLSTRPVRQDLAPPRSASYRDAVLRGAYRLVDGREGPGWDPDDNAVHIFAAGVMVPEAVEASRILRERGVFASVFAVTSPDRLYRGLREPRPYLETLVDAEEDGVPVVSMLDGHSHALAFVGSALGVSQVALGVDAFGQSGARRDLYRHYGIDAGAAVEGALTLLGRPKR